MDASNDQFARSNADRVRQGVSDEDVWVVDPAVGHQNFKPKWWDNHLDGVLVHGINGDIRSHSVIINVSEQHLGDVVGFSEPAHEGTAYALTFAHLAVFVEGRPVALDVEGLIDL